MITTKNTQTTDNQEVTSRLEQLTTTLREQEWIEFEFGSFMFSQFCDVLLGKRVQLVNGTIQSELTMKQIEEMDALTAEFSVLFCKSELRKTIAAMNVNGDADKRLTSTASIANELKEKRSILNQNIMLIEDEIKSK